ncbi:Histone-lysine N-methyltransferase, H3 lysine-79 specific [Rhizoctonia solani]|uniref:Histone-lysine N-methyltransferase, H3 lysine-79 specific n=1 Tax=Rhizoctonia solani TaxID=456999 RepID=A0A8H7M8N6_9AGAM|nr:Histone-lysine N-methyltransferase, H3 lysine-79 specific [Rhizoctonia solani]
MDETGQTQAATVAVTRDVDGMFGCVYTALSSRLGVGSRYTSLHNLDCPSLGILMLSIITPPVHPVLGTSKTVDDLLRPLTHPDPDSSATSPAPSLDIPTTTTTAAKKRKREPSEQLTKPKPKPKTVRKKRANNAKGKPRTASRTRERCVGSERMGALECTLPVEKWWRDPPLASEHSEPSQVAAGKHIQSIDIIRPKWKGYRPWFNNPQDPDDPAWKVGPNHIPSAELEYPGNNSTEVYALVDAFDHDDYQPLKDLFLTIDTIAGTYMDDADRARIGYTIPTSVVSSDPSSHASSSGHPHSPGRKSRELSPENESSDQDMPLYRRLIRARNAKDGPQFLQALATLNGHIRALRPKMQQHIGQMDWYSSSGVEACVRRGLSARRWSTHARAHQIQAVDEWSLWRTYATLHFGSRPPLWAWPGKVFVDLGSGVAQTLMQASLQSGCTSYGVELSPPAASIAKDHEREFNHRLEMWDLCCSEYNHIEGDMLESQEVVEWIRKADVILVNNFVFEELCEHIYTSSHARHELTNDFRSLAVNERLTCLFLDARDGTQISLKCFLDRGFKITERTISSPRRS